MSCKGKKRILVVAAHADDEVLGCGGAVARMAREGNDVFTVIMGEGVTSRDIVRDREKRAAEIARLKSEIQAANAIIGVKEIFAFDLPDNRFDSIPLLDVVKLVEKVKLQVKPNVIFTHFAGDLNIDHQVVNRAVLTAARPLAGEEVREIYAFEVLSSTEWNFPLTFSPDCFFDISDTIEIKVEAMAKYTSELRDYPHPRSLEGIRRNAEQWGIKVGLPFVEAFKTLRRVK